MISAATLNSELINKIAQDFAQATSILSDDAATPSAKHSMSHERSLWGPGSL